MKKIAESGRTSLPSAVLYLEDLEGFYKIIASESASGLAIIADSHQLAGSHELADLPAATGKRRLRSLSISAEVPRIVLRLGDEGGVIVFDAESTAAHGLNSKLQAAWIARKRASADMVDLLYVVFVAIAAYFAGRNSTHWLPSILLCVVALPVAGLVQDLTRRARTAAYVIRRTERRGFWTRKVETNWDRLSVAVIGGVIGLALTVLGAWIRSRYFGGV